MTGTSEFRRRQHGVALAMAGALGVTILTFGTIAVLDRTVAAPAFVDRVQAVLRADLFVIGWLAAAVANVARLRFFSCADIGGSSAGSATAQVRVARAILQNTLEQVVLAVIAHLVLAATLRHPQPLVIALVVLFGMGRLLFWAGYKRGPVGRAFGFALTFYPSVGALIVAAVVLLRG